jgi:hypothetical protein
MHLQSGRQIYYFFRWGDIGRLQNNIIPMLLHQLKQRNIRMEWVFNIQNGEHLIVILEAVGCNFDLQYK